jgi:hypothetical protein
MKLHQIDIFGGAMRLGHRPRRGPADRAGRPGCQPARRAAGTRRPVPTPAPPGGSLRRSAAHPLRAASARAGDDVAPARRSDTSACRRSMRARRSGVSGRNISRFLRCRRSCARISTRGPGWCAAPACRRSREPRRPAGGQGGHSKRSGRSGAGVAWRHPENHFYRGSRSWHFHRPVRVLRGPQPGRRELQRSRTRDCCAAATMELHRHELAVINIIYCHVASLDELRGSSLGKTAILGRYVRRPVPCCGDALTAVHAAWLFGPCFMRRVRLAPVP